MATKTHCWHPISNGHWCWKRPGHFPETHGKPGHRCSEECKHRCNCRGEVADGRVATTADA